MSRKHMIWMIIACTVPFLLIFSAPAFGIDSDTTLALFIIAMFAGHLFMMRSHSGHGQAGDDEQQEKGHQPHH